MDKLDAEMKRTDTLLYQMIPKQVADRLRRGEPAITTCEVSQMLDFFFFFEETIILEHHYHLCVLI